MFEGKFVSLIVTAAGSGSRMAGHENKLWISIGGKSVLERTLDNLLFADIFDEMILVISKSLLGKIQANLLPRIQERLPVKLVFGGKERQDSIANGLNVLSKESDYVLTHDGARPFVTKRIVMDILSALRTYSVAVPGVACKDTIKVAWENMEVVATPRREFLYQIQTPQAFHKQTLLKAYEKTKQEQLYGTDDASLAEKIGEKIKIVPGSYNNIKITTLEDILLGELIVKEEKGANRKRF